jgi:hypothetical protein
MTRDKRGTALGFVGLSVGLATFVLPQLGIVLPNAALYAALVIAVILLGLAVLPPVARRVGSRPRFEVTPRTILKMRESGGSLVYDSEAVLEIQNARSHGGDKGTAQAVTPEVEILTPNGHVVASNVGWEAQLAVDLPPTRVVHVAYVAFKEAGELWGRADLRSPAHTIGEPLWGSDWLVRLTLRGKNWRKPAVFEFRLISEGSSGDLRLERKAEP